MRSTLTPEVLESVDLVELIQFIVDQEACASTIVVCGLKETFLERLRLSTVKVPSMDGESIASASIDPNEVRTRPSTPRAQGWSIPTLRLLASSRTVKLVFCPDVLHLRACLATYARPLTSQLQASDLSTSALHPPPLLVVLNPIELHRPTSAYSAQGLNRSFAVAVEAAHRTRSYLVLAECTREHGNALAPTSSTDGENLFQTASPTTDPWSEEISILNVTTKSFGAGERGWVGRTVTIRSIAQRWCRFRKLGARGD